MAALIAPGTPAEGQAGGSAEPAKPVETKAPKAAPKAKAEAAPTEADKAKADKKPEPRAAPVPKDTREANISKFAKAMNSSAEKDGIEVDAPAEERRAKPGPKPGAKAAAVKRTVIDAEPAAPEPKPTAKVTQAQAADDGAGASADDDDASADEDADTGKPELRAHHQLKAKARLRHGDADKAIRLAFGDLKPEEFEATKEALAKKLGVGSKQWAEFRHFEKTERAKSKQLETNAVQLSQRLQADFGPMIEARKAYQAKDYPRAFELAFSEDINSFQRKAIGQHLSKDPESERLRQEIAELRAEVKKAREPAPVDPQEQQNVALRREADRTHEALVSQDDDPEIAFLARKAAFVRRVVEIRGEHFDPQSRTTLPLRVAADMARDELRRGQDEWRYDPQASGAAAPSSESPGQAGNEPVRTSRNARSPIPSQAAQAGGSTRNLTRAERITAFASRMS